MKARLSRELREILDSKEGRKQLKEFLVKSSRGHDEPVVIELGTRRYTVKSVEGGMAPKDVKEE